MTWFVDVLLGELAGTDEIVEGTSVPKGYRPIWSFALAPNAADPYVLLPADAPAAAQGALRGLGNPLRTKDRTAEWLGGVAMRTRLPQRFLPSLVVSAPGHVATHRTLLGHLASLVGRDDAVCAVILGRPRPNRKPVIKVLSPSGEVLAFAKVGWNDLTRGLVRAERANVERVAAARPLTFRLPTVLEAGPWGGLELFVTAPVPHARHRDGPPLRMPGDATREIAVMDGLVRAPFTGTAYRADLVARLEASGSEERGGLLGTAIDRIDDAWEDGDVCFGSWHGDWIPWNQVRSDGDLFVWDWERAATGVPAGLDVAHFRFDVEAKIRGRSPEEAARSSAAWSNRVASDIGAGSGSGFPLALVNLVEMCLRFREGRDAGVDASDSVYVRALRSLMDDPGAAEA
jgi:hypothetical protein